MPARKALPLLAALCLPLLTWPSSPVHAAARQVMVVHLSVSGAVHLQETLGTDDRQIGSCTQWGSGGRRYSVQFYSNAWVKERAQGRSPDGFILDMYPYRLGTTAHAGSLTWLLLTVVASHRVYAGDRTSVAGFRVEVAANGRSGSITVHHLPAGTGNSGAPITAHVRWTCAGLGH